MDVNLKISRGKKGSEEGWQTWGALRQVEIKLLLLHVICNLPNAISSPLLQENEDCC